ncbi:MAG: universal stress protein [Acidobacteriales bacterium]|nr:universal stress protein [Terriglobales bacterium]
MTPSRMTLPPKLILCPTDFSPASYAAVEAAVELAQHFGAELCLTYVVPSVPYLADNPEYDFKVPEFEEMLRQSSKEKLQSIADEYVAGKAPVRIVVCDGRAADEIVNVASAQKADLIVIATHGFTGWRHMAFGSVAEHVVRTALCPVLTIRVPDTAEVEK